MVWRINVIWRVQLYDLRLLLPQLLLLLLLLLQVMLQLQLYLLLLLLILLLVEVEVVEGRLSQLDVRLVFLATL